MFWGRWRKWMQQHQNNCLPVQGVRLSVLFIIMIWVLGCGVNASVPLPQVTTPEPRNFSWTRSNYPNPHTRPDLCGRGQGVSWVCDPANFLTKNEADQLDIIIQKTVNMTACQCGIKCGSIYHGGFKLSIAILPFLSSEAVGTPITADGSAQYLGQRLVDHLRLYSWRFGSCEDDMVLLYSVRDKRIFNSVGSTTRQVLKGSCESQLNGEFLDKNRSGQYSEALIHMVLQISEILQGSRKCTESWRVFQWWHILLFSTVVAFLIVITIIIFIRVWKLRPSCMRR